MLFKTRETLNGLNETCYDGSIFYHELPEKFFFEILKKDTTFPVADVILVDCCNTILTDELANRCEIKIPKGQKHLYFLGKNGQEVNIVFSNNGYIIDKKNQTVETL
jgi:hypothetical protein